MHRKKLLHFGIASVLFSLGLSSSILADTFSANAVTSTTITNTNLKEFPSATTYTITAVAPNSDIQILSIQDEWAWVHYKNSYGYLQVNTLEAFQQPKTTTNSSLPSVPTQPISTTKTSTALQPTTAAQTTNNLSKKERAAKVELTPWGDVKTIFKIGEPAEVYDVLTGRIYYVKSFSNGNHADVEPVTTNDTQIMFETFGQEWSWDVRPVWVTVGGKTMAGSINGMPHGTQTNKNNNMEGQICIHFKDSKTHNGNQDYTDLHQEVLLQAYDIAIKER